MAGRTPPWLVTGANGLLTSAVARRLEERGEQLILHVHRGRDRVAGLVQRYPVRAADLASPHGARDIAAWALSHAPLGGLVLGASAFVKTPLSTIDPPEIERQLRIEIGSHLEIIARLGPSIADGGVIILFSDVGVRLGWPSYPVYLAAKGALEAASRSLARSLGPRVVVTCVAPGSLEGAPSPPEGTLAGRTALGRAGTPEEVADAVIRWIGLPAGVIHGACLLVDGGRHLYA